MLTSEHPAVERGLAAIGAASGLEHLVRAKCSALLLGYHARWQHAIPQVLSVEQLVTAPLYNPDTQRRSRTFSLAGKLDLVAEQDNRRIIFDHKTTSDDIQDPNATYWRQLIVEAQPSHYMLLEWLNARKADGAVWDVVKKPGISPRKLAKKELDAVYFEGRYYDRVVSEDDLKALETESRETPAMYAARLVHDCVHERPQWYFQRRPVPRLDHELLDHAYEVWDHGQEIIQARANDRHGKNSGACMLYNSPCKFLGICSGHDTPDSTNWQRKKQVHVELPMLEGDGRDVLTNSRIKSYLTCRRKHYYEYELGIERVLEEEKEALFFGTVWHLGLESYFLAIQEEQQNGCINSYPANEVGTANAATEVHAR